MSALAADRSFDSSPDNLKLPLSLSVAMHVTLGALLIYSGLHTQSGDLWGGPGGAITVGLVGNVPGIPMPRPEIETPNRVVDESKGLYKAEPPPEITPTGQSTAAAVLASVATSPAVLARALWAAIAILVFAACYLALA